MSNLNENDPKVIAAKIIEESNRKSNKSKVKVSRFGLLLVGIITSLVVFLAHYRLSYSYNKLWLEIAVSCCYYILFALSFRKAFLAFLIGLLLYLSYLIFLLTVGIEFLMSGYVLKIIVLGLLLSGLRASRLLPVDVVTNEELLDDMN